MKHKIEKVCYQTISNLAKLVDLKYTRHGMQTVLQTIIKDVILLADYLLDSVPPRTLSFPC